MTEPEPAPSVKDQLTDPAAARWVCDLCGVENGHSGRVMLTDTGLLICYGGCP